MYARRLKGYKLIGYTIPGRQQRNVVLSAG